VSAARRERWEQRCISVVWLRSVRFGAIEFMSFSPSFGCLSDLSLGSFSQLFLSAFSVGSCLAVFFRLLFSLVSSLQRNFLLVIFAENASNDSIWIRLARIFPTRVSSLLSAGFFFPSRRLMFDEMSSICSLSIRLVQAIPTLV
jgi:hypothetical protein